MGYTRTNQVKSIDVRYSVGRGYSQGERFYYSTLTEVKRCLKNRYPGEKINIWSWDKNYEWVRN